MISAAVLELGGSDVDDPLPCTVGNQMYETEQVLTGVTEAHAAADARFVIGSGTGHVESYHTLILVPDIDHAVHLIVRRFHAVFGKQSFPVVI